MKITFNASLPDILSAITLAGSKDSGARIKLDLPASDVGAAILLQQHGAGKLLQVTIETVEPKPKRMLSDNEIVDNLLSELKLAE